MGDEANPSGPTSRPDGQSVLQAAQSGDTDALGSLLGDLRPRLVAMVAAILRKRMGAKAEPSDIVQQGLEAACEGIGEFRGSTVAEFQAWVVSIVRREIWDTLRHWGRNRRDASREQPGALSDLAADTSTPSSPVRRREEVEQVMSAIEQLPEEERILVRLRHLEGWGLKEIALLTGRNPAAIAGSLKRALHQVRWQLRRSQEEQSHV